MEREELINDLTNYADFEEIADRNSHHINCLRLAVETMEADAKRIAELQSEIERLKKVKLHDESIIKTFREKPCVLHHVQITELQREYSDLSKNHAEIVRGVIRLARVDTLEAMEAVKEKAKNIVRDYVHLDGGLTENLVEKINCAEILKNMEKSS